MSSSVNKRESSSALSASTDAIARLVSHGHAEHTAIATHQTQHRISLVQFWEIKEGEKVLEIGCGQGDCTAVLATAVGESGHVTAIDPADLNYGARCFISNRYINYKQLLILQNRITDDAGRRAGEAQVVRYRPAHHLPPDRPGLAFPAARTGRDIRV